MFTPDEIYLVKLPFCGSIENSAYKDEDGIYRARYTGKRRVTQGDRVLQEGTPDITLEEYLAGRDDAAEIVQVSDDALSELWEQHTNGLKSLPQPIDAERFQEMLEVLPPCRWSTVAGAEVFHVSERLTGNLVSWFIRKGENHFTMTQDAAITKEDLTKLIIAA